MSPSETPLRRHAAFVLIGVLALSLAACGGSGTSDTTAAPTTTNPPETTTTLPPGTVKVTLSDVSATSMLLTPSPSSTSAGEVTFVVSNTGTQEHEFVVLRTDLAAADLPFDSTADEALEEGEGVTPVDEIEGIQPGETKTLVVDLEAGHYALICNLKGHYRMGMRSDFDVT